MKKLFLLLMISSALLGAGEQQEYKERQAVLSEEQLLKDWEIVLANAEEELKNLQENSKEREQEETRREKVDIMPILRNLLGLEHNYTTSDLEDAQTELTVNENDVDQEEIQEARISKKQKRRCDQCDYLSPYISNLKKHKALEHQEGEVPVGILACDMCDFKCNSESHLKYHKERVHEEKKPYSCECGYKAYYEYHLKRHQQGNGCKARRFDS
jgi:hypothetical protein